jgi:poly(A) polymerase
VSAAPSIADRAPWLFDPGLQKLLGVLSQGREEARVAGGAVRNALLGEPVTDIDIATTTAPEETTRRAEAAGFKVKPTGIEHGTVTVIIGRHPYEVTTLRADVETHGRHAKVAFGRDWETDAARRDFTINALYASADGTVVDFVGGLADLESRTIRFIDDADKRIREDFLRILRFFRFFAWYGSGRPDAEGLKACARLKDGVKALSAERVWAELKKLLSAPDPSRALLWLRQTGVLSVVLPESEKWGIDAIHCLVKTEKDLGWQPDVLLRLEAIIPPNLERIGTMAARLKLSNAQTERLSAWAATSAVAASVSDNELAKALYRGERQGLEDRLRLSLAWARDRAPSDAAAMAEAVGYGRLLTFVKDWRTPEFPLRGKDLLDLGATSGPSLGALLKELENDWIESGFRLEGDALKARAAERIKA